MPSTSGHWWETGLTWIILSMRYYSMLCSREEWKSTQCSRGTSSSHTPLSKTWLKESNLEQLLYISWVNVYIIFSARQLKNTQTNINFTFKHLNSTQVITYPLYLHCFPLALYLVFSLDQQSVHWTRSTPCLKKKWVGEYKTWSLLFKANTSSSALC